MKKIGMLISILCIDFYWIETMDSNMIYTTVSIDDEEITHDKKSFRKKQTCLPTQIIVKNKQGNYVAREKTPLEEIEQAIVRNNHDKVVKLIEAYNLSSAEEIEVLSLAVLSKRITITYKLIEKDFLINDEIMNYAQLINNPGIILFLSQKQRLKKANNKNV